MSVPLNFKDAVDVLNTTTFTVLAGFALTHFVSESEMVEEYGKTCSRAGVRLLFYWSSVFMLASLALRFLIGSKIHLLATYAEGTNGTIGWFLHDAIFLFVFGVILVKVAWAKDPMEFTGWLIALLAGAVLWSFDTLLFGNDAGFASFWIWLDSGQLLITLIGFVIMQLYPARRLSADSKLSAYLMMTLAILYLGGLLTDLKGIMKTHSAPTPPRDFCNVREPQTIVSQANIIPPAPVAAWPPVQKQASLGARS